jgi:hypothetical protein
MHVISGNFKLYGESLAVPTLTYEELQLQVVVTVVVVLSYHIDTKTWLCEDLDNDFEISLKDFTGPYGLPKTVVNAVLGVATPLLREHILRHLAEEAGTFVTQLPVPLVVKGLWSVQETYSIEQLLDNPIFTSTRLSEAMKCTPLQLLSFVSIQKSLRRHTTPSLPNSSNLTSSSFTSSRSMQGGSEGGVPLLLTLTDLLKYIRTYRTSPPEPSTHTAHAYASHTHSQEVEGGFQTSQQEAEEDRWTTLKGLWDEASLVFFSLTKTKTPAVEGNVAASFFSFENLLQGIKTIELNPIQVGG